MFDLAEETFEEEKAVAVVDHEADGENHAVEDGDLNVDVIPTAVAVVSAAAPFSSCSERCPCRRR